MKTQRSWLALIASLLLWAPATVAEEQSLSLLLLPPIAGEGSAQLAISWQGHAHGQLELLVTDVDGQTRSIKTLDIAPGMHLEPVTTSAGDVSLVAVLRDANGRELARAEHETTTHGLVLPAQFDQVDFAHPPHAESRPIAGAKGSSVDWKAAFAGNNAPDRTVSAMAIYDDGTGPALVIGGEFATAGGLVVNGLARWNGTSWSGLGNGGGSGVDGSVRALTVVGADLYVGGAFLQVNIGGPTVNANCVARWNGSQWASLGSGGGYGVSGPFGCTVSALASMNADLYVGGIFAQANVDGAPVPANAVARWSPSTSTWSSLGTGTLGGGVSGNNNSPGWVYALAVLDSQLYVGGFFTSADGISANHVARWNGTQWAPLGSVGGNGLAQTVYTLAVLGGELYVGGLFDRANAGGPPVPANAIARWSPATSTWSSVGTGGGNGVSATGNTVVRSLLAKGNELYVGGTFWRANVGGVEVPAGNVARWTPATAKWSGLGANAGLGLTGGFQAEVFALAAMGGELHVGGRFSRATTVSSEIDAANISRWNPISSTWHPLGAGHGLTGSQSSAVASARAVAVLGDYLYVGGDFTRVAGGGTSIVANRIARWNGSSWSALGSGGGNGVGGTVLALAALGGELYVAGSFIRANIDGPEVTANRLARWNPMTGTWSGVGSGGGSGVGTTTAGVIWALATLGTDLYVGGAFSQVNTGGPLVNANGIARWNGGSWSALGSGTGNGLNGAPRAMAVMGGDLYVGGYFQRANPGGLEVLVNNIARWNGSTWASLGSGGGIGVGHPNGWDVAGVLALAVLGNDLYAGGEFTRVNEGGTVVDVNRIARWDGSNWSSVGSGGGNGVSLGPSTSAIVNALTALGGSLYVGGAFREANAGGPAIGANNIARWDGNNWTSVGSGRNGTDGTVFALATAGADLLAGGQFGRAGSVPSGNVAIYGLTEPSVSTITSTSPSISNPGEDVLIRVRVTSSIAPASGHVTVTGAPGGSCTDLTLTYINATTVEAECSIRWNSDGAQTLIARYTGGSSGGTSWGPSASVPFLHTVAALFDDGFEAQSP